MSKTKLLATAALALVGLAGVGAAHAGEPQVSWSVTIGTPGRVVVPSPVFVRPIAVPVQVARVPDYHRGYQQPSRWDRDGDGVPNRYDRVYNPRWDRDGDGVPNGRDRHDNRRHDRDGDGIPNRYDRR
jgi:hypothetical protein